MTPSRVIDVHTHVFPDHVAARAIPSLAEGAGVEPTYDGTLSGLLSEMDRAGIEASVIQPVATKPEQVAGVNDWAASIAGDRIVAFGAMHPGVEDAAAEVGRMAGLGIRGFKMHPEYQEFAPDEPRMDALYEATEAHGLVVLFHAGVDIALPSLRGTPASFARINEAHPGLKAILAHMGGYDLWPDVMEHLAGRDVFFDTSYTLGHLPDDEFIAACTQDLRDMIDVATAGDIAGMIAEPIQGVGGFATPPDGFFGA